MGWNNLSWSLTMGCNNLPFIKAASVLCVLGFPVVSHTCNKKKRAIIKNFIPWRGNGEDRFLFRLRRSWHLFGISLSLIWSPISLNSTNAISQPLVNQKLEHTNTRKDRPIPVPPCLVGHESQVGWCSGSHGLKVGDRLTMLADFGSAAASDIQTTTEPSSVGNQRRSPPSPFLARTEWSGVPLLLCLSY